MNTVNKYSWKFPLNNDGQFHGIGDSGIDLFKGDPVKSLTREICQNSIDARKDENKPVKVEFECFEIEKNIFPGLSQLIDTYEQAYAFCKKQNFRKAIKYFEREIPVLKGEKFIVLRISDLVVQFIQKTKKEFLCVPV